MSGIGAAPAKNSDQTWSEMDDGGEDSDSTGSNQRSFEEDSTDADAEVDSEDSYKLSLIEEVKKYPALWTKHNDRQLKNRLWYQAVEVLYLKKWSKMTAIEQHTKVEKAKKKWKNMKDCFMRYTNAANDKRKGKKVRRYRYATELKFLLQTVYSSKIVPRALKRKSCEDNAKKSTPGTSDCRGSKRSSKRPRNELASNQVSSGPTSNMREDAAPSRQPTNYQPMMTPFETAMVEILRAKHEEGPDEDEHFCNSLIPMFWRLDEDQKHYAKTSILNVIRNARNLVLDASVDLPVPFQEARYRVPFQDDRCRMNVSPHVDESPSFPSSTNEICPFELGPNAIQNESSDSD